ncbi:MAG: glycosyltransferase family 2 protein [Kiritimatiellae bacterium]|nr:glycosyltransferase family 2 protein [Kiritimatiellia bacterium]
MPGDQPFASILIRAHNDETWIERTLQGVFAQRTDFLFEVLVCDDSSTDRTREIAARFPVRFIKRPDGAYKPGRTLNTLVNAAQGELVVFNNADAVPLNGDWLSSLVKPLRDTPDRPVFTFANQLPRTDARALVRKDHARAFGDGKVQATWRFFFSLASSATWKRFLIDSPFDEEIQYSEDIEWTWRNSHREIDPVTVVYCPDAQVEHSHNYTFGELARRFRGEGKADAQIFGDAPCLLHEIIGAGRETLRDWLYLQPHPGSWSEALSAPLRRLVQRISHWRGMRDAVQKSRSGQ